MRGVSLGKGKVVHSTDKALKVDLEDRDEPLWIPKSVIHDDSELFDDGDNDNGELVVNESWAEKEGLT